MRLMVKVWCGVVITVALACICAPMLASSLGDPMRTVAPAYSSGGPWGLGFDYLGRPVAPQLLLGGRKLLFAACASAALTNVIALIVGLWLASKSLGSQFLLFILDVLLVIPMTVISLISFVVAGSSLYATIPVAAILTVPFTARYYQANARPLFRTGFFEQALVAGDGKAKAAIREIVPVLWRSILIELGMSFIAAIYLMSTVSFLGTSAQTKGFLWPTMVSQNTLGILLNPWAVCAPIIAIVTLTVPLNLLVDALGRQKS